MNNKKIMKLIMMSVVISGGILMSEDEVKAQPNIVSTGIVYNVSTNLRVRSNPDLNGEIIASLNNGQEVIILGESGNWYQIDYNNQMAYVSKDYIKTSSSQENSSRSISGKVVNISSTLRVRSGAGTNYQVIGYLTNGTNLNITGESGDWYIINYDGQSGYVSKEYVSVTAQGNNNSSNSNNSSNVSIKEGTVVNVSTNLRVRSGAGTNYVVLGYLTNGSKVSITDENGSWYAISYNGKTGYVSKEYISINSSSLGPSDTGSESNTTGYIVNISSNLRVRSGAGTSYSTLGYLNNGSKVNILGESGDWYKISYNDGHGYVSKQYVSVGSNDSSSNAGGSNDTSQGSTLNQYGQVVNVSSNLRVRSNPSASASVVTYLLNGAKVNIIGESGNWYKITYGGHTGYVSKDYIRIISSDSSGSTTSSAYETILNAMKQHLGTPYVWGGSGELLTTSLMNTLKSRYPYQNYSRAMQYVDKGYRAFDCSGLMQWGFAQAGIQISRTTYTQVNEGVEVAISDIKPGDLLFYSNLEHVGMYVGNDQWIESPNSNANIRIVSVPWSKIGRARRILN